ncbi:hypothetical protein Y882_07195 [Dyella japonica DSM 16301]|uniref:Uncharacterized protein n=1 Tax=Dyella japonica DSM 16301 TaxID=1440762 RepID=A0A0G9H4C4_9GAMM|nr:hypothetical protein Y882_07195 [Dyella japonica DSM 16301]
MRFHWRKFGRSITSEPMQLEWVMRKNGVEIRATDPTTGQNDTAIAGNFRTGREEDSIQILRIEKVAMRL